MAYTQAQLRALEILDDDGNLFPADQWAASRDGTLFRIIDGVSVDYVSLQDLACLMLIRNYLGENEKIPYPENPKNADIFRFAGRRFQYTTWISKAGQWSEF